MNLQAIKPQNIIAAAALLAPVALVQTVRIFFGGGPGHASAMSPGSDAPAAPLAPGAPTALPMGPVFTSAQKTAIEHLKVQRGEITIFTSPFNHLVPKAATVQASMPSIEPTPENPEPRAAELPPDVRALSLGALMMNENGPFAVVSGRVRTVGEVIVPGWTVSAIDTVNRRVTITSDEGVAVTLTQNR